jgi:peroxiredoxin
VDELYEKIETNEKLRQRIKIIGIGAGNSEAEVKIYKDSYKVPFPLFADDDFSIHKALGQVKTPYFIAVRIHEDGTHKVFYSEVGAFKEAGDFLELMIKLSGLK